MLSKESKIRALENFYALDYVLFGKSISKVETCCPLVKEEYLSIKGALLSVFVEMIKLVGHSPKRIEERTDSKSLIKNARYSAQHARENAQRIVSSDKSRQNIKESMRDELKNDQDADITKVVEQKIREKAFSLAVDNLLLARVVSESKNFDALNTWEGRLIEDSYKILRDNLVEASYQVLYSDEVLEEDEKKKLNETKSEIEEIVPLVPIAVGAAVGGAIGVAKWIKIKKVCKAKFGNDPEKYKNCVKTLKKKHSSPGGMVKKTKVPESKIFDDLYKPLTDQLVKSFKKNGLGEAIPLIPGTVAAIAGVYAVKKMKIRKACREKFPNDKEKYKACIKNKGK